MSFELKSSSILSVALKSLQHLPVKCKCVRILTIVSKTFDDILLRCFVLMAVTYENTLSTMALLTGSDKHDSREFTKHDATGPDELEESRN